MLGVICSSREWLVGVCARAEDSQGWGAAVCLAKDPLQIPTSTLTH